MLTFSLQPLLLTSSVKFDSSPEEPVSSLPTNGLENPQLAPLKVIGFAATPLRSLFRTRQRFQSSRWFQAHGGLWRMLASRPYGEKKPLILVWVPTPFLSGRYNNGYLPKSKIYANQIMPPGTALRTRSFAYSIILTCQFLREVPVATGRSLDPDEDKGSDNAEGSAPLFLPN